MHRLVVIAVAATLLAVGVVVPSPALGRTPVVVDVPPAELCRGPSQRSLAPLFASPAAGAPAALPAPFAPPAGRPADAATEAAVTAATRAVIARINSSRSFPVPTLVSDDSPRERRVDDAPLAPLSEELRPCVEALRGRLTRELEPPAEAERFGTVAVEQARRLDDGRVSAVVHLSAPAAAEGGTRLPAVDDRLLVDEIVAILEEDEGAAGAAFPKGQRMGPERPRVVTPRPPPPRPPPRPPPP